MLVRATAKGYYGQLRKPGGKSFEIDPRLFTSTWMEKVEGSPAATSDEPSEVDAETQAARVRGLRKTYKELYGKKAEADMTAEQLEEAIAKKEPRE